jgi:RNA recognition motif-containing protein
LREIARRSLFSTFPGRSVYILNVNRARFRVARPSSAPAFPAFSTRQDQDPNKDTRMNIYVSNISYAATDEALHAAFAAYGEVQSARIIKDRVTSRSRGFGFVEMPNEEEGKKALEALAGFDLMGRAIAVREARPREEGEPKQAKQKSQGNGEKPRAEKPRQPELVIIQRGMY